MSNFFQKQYFVFLAVCLFVTVMMTGCSGNNEQGSSGEIIADNLQKMEEKVDSEAVTKDTVDGKSSFADPFVEGTLSYTVESCNVYQNLKDAGIAESELLDPHNIYHSSELGEQYQKVGDFVKDDGSIVETHQLVVIDLKIENQDAVGMVKKNEFLLSNINLQGGENAAQYNPAYFSEAGKVDAEQPFYYTLEQGQTLEAKLAYLVLKEDMGNLVGIIRDTDVQFSID